MPFLFHCHSIRLRVQTLHSSKAQITKWIFEFFLSMKLVLVIVKGSVLVDSISTYDFSRFRYCFEIAFGTFGDVHPFDIIAEYVACCVLCI